MPSTRITAIRNSLLGSLAMVSMASAQSVPGFTVETFSTPPSPNLLAFGLDGLLFAGRDDNAQGSITPVMVTKITPAGVASSYGLAPIFDPDALVVDITGEVGGIANSVLVGGLITDTGPGRVSAIHPNGTVVTLFEEASYGNISELKIDDTGRLLFVSFNGNTTFASERGAIPTALFATGTSPVFLTLAPDGRIFTSNQSGTVRINAANGDLINASLAQFSGRVSIEFAQGGGFGSDLLALEQNSGTLYSVSARGVKTQIGTGLTGSEDIAVGPCGAVYVSRRLASEVLRISKPASPDINSSGQVDAADLALLLGAWGTADCAMDFNEDGTVNAADLAVLLGAWGRVG